MVERKTIKDFENYSITENGDVYNKFGKLMKCQINDKGYCFVFLRMNKKSFHRFIHRLVYITFVDDILENYSIDHIDNNKKNNHVSNLQMMTRSENTLKWWYETPAYINEKLIIPDGFIKIENFENYYININCEILSYNKTNNNMIEGKSIKTYSRSVKLCKNGIVYWLSKKALLKKYFNVGKESNIKYKYI